MSLGAGQKLGPYEIVAPIGAGGMGEVYRARDTRLDRTVAVKILREDFAESAERRERFEREAKALSQLNHPHICTLHDVGKQDGVDYLVMELVSGESLADRLSKGPLPFHQALSFAMQIADALDAAHRHGIVHRDLKPGNIMVTESGVKLLDFGLARLVVGAAVADSVLDTQHKPLTSDGAILGTFQYMAPEQLEGKGADARTDIFALGVVLHEMLTGQKAFSGTSQASLIAAILARDPEPISKLAPLSPRALDRVVARCMAKDPEARWSSAREVRELLGFVSEDGGAVPSPTPRASSLPWAIAASAIAAALGVAAFSRVEPPAPQPVGHFVIVPPEEAPFHPTRWGKDLAISPSGAHLVWVTGVTGDALRLYLRPLGETTIKTLVPPGQGAEDPFFSPDGEWVGFHSFSGWKRISVSGGPPTTLWSTTEASWGGSFGPNQSIVLATGNRETGLLLLPAGAGEPEVLTRPNVSTGEFDHVWPEFLPNGKAVLFDVVSEASTQVAVLSLETKEWKVLVANGANAVYFAAGETGYILFAAEGALRAVEFDPDRLEVTGSPFPVLERVNQKPLPSYAVHYAVSRNGILVYNPNSGRVSDQILVWVDRDGRIEPLPLPAAAYNDPSLSPDGGRIALTVTDETGANVWVYDTERKTLGKRTFGGDNRFPVWTGDGQEVVYGGTSRSTLWSLMRLRADGSSGGEELGAGIERMDFQVPTSWSNRHRTLLYQYGSEIWKLSLEQEKAERFLSHAGATVREARFSLDETHVAYRSDETGRDEIYVVPFPGPGGKWQISTDGGAQAMWSPNGNELFYKNGNRMMVVDVRTNPTFEAGAPRVLFETDLPESAPGDPSRYGVAPDGRFLVIAPSPDADEENQPEIHVVVNWAETLRRRN